MPRSRRRKIPHQQKGVSPMTSVSRNTLTHMPLGQPNMSGRPMTNGRVNYTIVVDFPPGHPQYGLSNGAIGSPGNYEVTVVLAIPGMNVVQENSNFPEMMASGDSLLEVSSVITEMAVTVTDSNLAIDGQSIKIGINSHHRISSLSLVVQANSFQDASTRAHNAIMPILSRWSFLHDISITTSVTQVCEMATSVRSWTHLIRGTVKAFSDEGGTTTPEVHTLLAAYREGISSTEPLYQALSLSKVVDGVYKLRGRRKAAVISAGKPYREPSERIHSQSSIPSATWQEMELKSALEPYAGKKFTQVRDVLHAVIRNAIAHLDPGSDPLIPDRYENVEKVYQAIPVLKYMARILLASELPQSWLVPPKVLERDA